MYRTSPLSFPRARTLVAIALAVCLAGCAVGPDYRKPPTVDTGSGWIQPGAAGSPAHLADWWQSLGDPVLDRLVDQALTSNLDIRQAAERIDEARALRDRAAGGQAPSVRASGNVTRRQQSLNGPLPIGVIPGVSRNQTIYNAGFDASWEVDLFGGTRRAVESADATLQATREDARNVRISVAAEVARTYLSLRGAQRELAARKASVATLAHTRDLVRLRVKVGDAAEADLEQAQAALDAAAAVLPGIEAQRHAAALGLGLLLGQPPEHELALEQHDTAPIDLHPLPVGQRADLLRRRPDVRAAERRLAASSANIGAATAELFPKLSINASGGFQSLDAGTLTDAGSRTWSIAPLISWRVFDGGRVHAEIRAAKARERGAALAYEKAVLSALNDAEQALSSYRLDLQAVSLRDAALASARRSYNHAQHRYEAGDIALLDLLANERGLHDAEDADARSHTQAAIELVALYKALGGGWASPDQPKAASPSTPQAGSLP